MGIVDLTSLTWEQFWIGVAYIMISGTLFSLGILRLVQQRVRAGLIMLGSAVVSAVLIFSVIYHFFLP
ncbi:hypothetical protein [Brevibacillus migulae]|uniref:hypothetical protein n=1 Tax=Brevibacillus migulae TaxID=1644114 RepID=UPI00106DE036|nr:hypothetical protein [Brevibacillus migulae]